MLKALDHIQLAMPAGREYDACGFYRDLLGLSELPKPPHLAARGAYLAAAGEGYAMQTLRRRVAAIARASGVAGHPLHTKHPAIRETLRGIGRTHVAAAAARRR